MKLDLYVRIIIIIIIIVRSYYAQSSIGPMYPWQARKEKESEN